MTRKRNGFEQRKDAGSRAVLHSSLNAFASKLNWQELPGAHYCCIATWRQDRAIKVETQCGAYLCSIVQRIIKMTAVVRPMIQELL